MFLCQTVCSVAPLTQVQEYIIFSLPVLKCVIFNTNSFYQHLAYISAVAQTFFSLSDHCGMFPFQLKSHEISGTQFSHLSKYSQKQTWCDCTQYVLLTNVIELKCHLLTVKYIPRTWHITCVYSFQFHFCFILVSDNVQMFSSIEAEMLPVQCDGHHCVTTVFEVCQTLVRCVNHTFKPIS